MKEEKPNSRAISSTILELYKLHVEMADRVSQRRAVANNWFITINFSIFSLGSYIGIKGNLREVALLCFLGLCLPFESLHSDSKELILDIHQNQKSY